MSRAFRIETAVNPEGLQLVRRFARQVGESLLGPDRAEDLELAVAEGVAALNGAGTVALSVTRDGADVVVDVRGDGSPDLSELAQMVLSGIASGFDVGSDSVTVRFAAA